ncbi:sigma-70 family RNA polymerase sigma factor [Nocardioides albidus]|uniref:Sigma-70 family RNA polymerase sigma factor n=1 Tax=Nocardioides albidus TaxID=1517589 RepID=A0A5C4VYF6_9ACTN|nr:sigma-70 family RNA polymerase sigma factor [Nocardioides albidus]TNM40376.1 sigma-70 family RNA polymerase sigma factor [Nocardioides albidus]
MDAAEFDEFYTASFRRVSGQVYAMIGDLDEATECTQEAFARAWAHRRRLDRAEHPEAWVRTTAHRLAVSRWRRRKRGERSPDRALQATGVARAVDESHVALVAALSRIPEAQRQALVLHHIADLPVHQVAAEVGVPEGTIKARLSRGRAALAALLADEPGRAEGGATHA